MKDQFFPDSGATSSSGLRENLAIQVCYFGSMGGYDWFLPCFVSLYFFDHSSNPHPKTWRILWKRGVSPEERFQVFSSGSIHTPLKLQRRMEGFTEEGA